MSGVIEGNPRVRASSSIRCLVEGAVNPAPARLRFPPCCIKHAPTLDPIYHIIPRFSSRAHRAPRRAVAYFRTSPVATEVYRGGLTTHFPFQTDDHICNTRKRLSKDDKLFLQSIWMLLDGMSVIALHARTTTHNENSRPYRLA